LPSKFVYKNGVFTIRRFLCAIPEDYKNILFGCIKHQKISFLIKLFDIIKFDDEWSLTDRFITFLMKKSKSLIPTNYDLISTDSKTIFIDLESNKDTKINTNEKKIREELIIEDIGVIIDKLTMDIVTSILLFISSIS
jgi:hypothetical protein